jgi:hypothetical protein
VNRRLDALETRESGSVSSDAESNAPATTAATAATATVVNLRHDDHLSARLQQRLAELQVDVPAPGATQGHYKNAKGKTSGSTRTADDVYIQKDVLWPDFYVCRSSERRPMKYDKLTKSEFVYGFLSMIEESIESQNIKDKMLTRLKVIMRDTADFAWPIMRNFFRILMQDFEKGKLNWKQDFKIQEMRLLFIHRLNCENRAPVAPGPPSKTYSLLCLDYQDGSCRHNSDHNSSQGFLEHNYMCFLLQENRQCLYPHRSRMQAKNPFSVKK